MWLYRHSDFTDAADWRLAERNQRLEHNIISHSLQVVTDKGQLKAFTAIISWSVCHFVHTMTGRKIETWNQPPKYWQTTWILSLCKHKVAKQLFLLGNPTPKPKEVKWFHVFAAHYCVMLFLTFHQLCIYYSIYLSLIYFLLWISQVLNTFKSKMV